MKKLIVIEGAGEFPIPTLDDCSFGELGLIEKITGARGNEMYAVFDEGGALGLIAIAAVAIKRAEHPLTVPELLEMKLDQITTRDEPEPEDDPTVPPTSDSAATSSASATPGRTSSGTTRRSSGSQSTAKRST